MLRNSCNLVADVIRHVRIFLGDILLSAALRCYPTSPAEKIIATAIRRMAVLIVAR